MNCNSGARIFSDVWREWDDVILRAGCAALAAAKPDAAIDCLDKAGKLNQATDQMVVYWNRMAGSSWARIGPRRLDPDTNLTGRLFSTGGRMFITPAPMDVDEATVQILERDGKAKTEVVVCKATPDGKTQKLATLWFNEDKPAKRNQSEKESVRVKGIKGSLLMIHLDAKSLSLKFGYTLRVST